VDGSDRRRQSARSGMYREGGSITVPLTHSLTHLLKW
jgi:hypothetical protein